MQFKNKNILITGGSRGIGKSTAITFASMGANVGINYNSDDSSAKNTLELLDGNNHTLLKYDISEKDAPKQIIAEFIDKYGKIDVLVNNAGISDFHSVNDDFDEWQESWNNIINVNLLSAANMCYWASKNMIVNGGGRIINVSSRGAFRGEPNKPAYAASKAGLNAMSQSMAKALAKHNVFVYVVAPGFTETDMALTTLTPEEKEKLLSDSPFKRMAKPEEVANAIAYFASEGSEYSSGAILDINGASYLRT